MKISPNTGTLTNDSRSIAGLPFMVPVMPIPRKKQGGIFFMENGLPVLIALLCRALLYLVLLAYAGYRNRSIHQQLASACNEFITRWHSIHGGAQ